MTDKTDSKERDLMALIDAYAEARHIGGCHTYNAKTAEARNAVIAKLAASAGSEPVAWVDERALSWLANSRSLSATITTKLEKGKSFERPTPLYLNLSPPEGMVMVPANAEDVRAFIGSQYETLEYGHQDGDEAHENDRYTLTVHDLLSAFRWWAENMQFTPPTSSADSSKEQP